MNPKLLKMARPVAKLQQGRNDWYRIENKASDKTAASVYIYDEIGYWGVTAADFVRDLNALDSSVKTIDVHLNSPGGEVYDGITIYNALKNHSATVTTIVDGLAASAASFIAQAGKKRIACKNSTLMIHDASGLCIGNSVDMRDLADKLDKMSDNIASIYSERAGGSIDFWREAMRAESWYSAEEAKSAGLIDELDSTSEDAASNKANANAASWDLSIFNHPGRDDAPPPPQPAVAKTEDSAPTADEDNPDLVSAALLEALKEAFR
jgi:ATP-dependent Clp endopeptidase proteolytic subunit ClpP